MKDRKKSPVRPFSPAVSERRHPRDGVKGRPKFFAYLVAVNLLITGMLGISLYIQAEKSLRAGAERSNRRLLEQLDRSINVVLDEFDKSMATLILDFAVADFIDYYRGQDYLMLRKVYESLNNFLAVNRFVNSLHIYYRDGDMVLSPVFGVMNVKDYYDRELVGRVMAEGGPYGWLDERTVPETFSELPIRVLTVIKPIPLIYYTPQALVIVTLRQKFLEDIILSLQQQDGNRLFLLSESKSIIAHSNSDEMAGEIAAVMQAVSFSGNSGSLNRTIGGVPTLITYKSSAGYPWKYVSAVPYSEVIEGIAYLRVFSVVLILFAVALTVASTFWFSRIINKTFLSLASLFPRQGKKMDHRDVVGYIAKNITSLTERNREIEELLERTRQGMRNTFLLRLLRSRIEPGDTAAERFAYYEVTIQQFSYHAVILISPDNIAGFQERYSEQDKGLLAVGLASSVIRTLPNDSDAVVIDDDPAEIKIILGCHEPDQNLVVSLARAVKEYREADGQDVTIGVSGFHQGIAGIGRCYREAARALQHRIVLGGGQTIFFREVIPEKDEKYEFPFVEEKRLIDEIRQGNTREALSIVSQIFDPRNSEQPKTPEQVKFVAVQLFCAIMGFFSEIGGRKTDLTMGDDLFGNLMLCSTAESFSQWFHDLVSQIRVYIEKRRNERNPALAAKIEEYIRHYYHDPNLSLVSISEAVYYSISHICRCYKEERGESLKEYINKVRLEKAKLLLRDHGKSITQVALLVGYNQLQSFIKIFKKYTGETPGDYRRKMEVPDRKIP